MAALFQQISIIDGYNLRDNIGLNYPSYLVWLRWWTISPIVTHLCVKYHIASNQM